MKRFFANLNIIKHVAQTNNLEIVPSVFPVGYANDLLYNSPNLIEGLPVTNTLLVVSNNLAPIQPSPPVAFPSAGFSDLSKWSSTLLRFTIFRPEQRLGWLVDLDQHRCRRRNSRLRRAAR